MVLNMGKKRVFLLLVSLVMMSLLSNVVFAQIGDLDIDAAYEKYHLIIDGLIYFLFFISIAQVTIGKQFEGSAGKGVVVAVGLALTVSVFYWVQRTGFTLLKIWPFAMFILVALIVVWLFRSLKGDQKIGSGIWTAIIVIFIAVYMFFPGIIITLQNNRFGNLALSALGIIFLIAVLMFLFSVLKTGPGGGSLGDSGGPGFWNAIGDRLSRRNKAEKAEERIDKKESSEERKLRKLLKKLYDDLKNKDAETTANEVRKKEKEIQDVIDKLKESEHDEEEAEKLSERHLGNLGYDIGDHKELLRLIKGEEISLNNIEEIFKDLKYWVEIIRSRKLKDKDLKQYGEKIKTDLIKMIIIIQSLIKFNFKEEKIVEEIEKKDKDKKKKVNKIKKNVKAEKRINKKKLIKEKRIYTLFHRIYDKAKNPDSDTSSAGVVGKNLKKMGLEIVRLQKLGYKEAKAEKLKEAYLKNTGLNLDKCRYLLKLIETEKISLGRVKLYFIDLVRSVRKVLDAENKRKNESGKGRTKMDTGVISDTNTIIKQYTKRLMTDLRNMAAITEYLMRLDNEEKRVLK